MDTNTELSTKSVVATNSYKLDFIKEYVEYADIFEAPPEAHEAVALTAISGVANGNVWIDNGGQQISLDNWTLLLSGSGVGRNTLVSLLWPILHEAGLDGLVRNITWGSKQGFYQDLADHPRGFLIWEELASALKALSDARFGEAKQWLTNCYDNFRQPADIQYRTGSTQNTPPIVFTTAPRVSILATSSQAWFIDSLSQEDSLGGFIPRWLPHSEPPDREGFGLKRIEGYESIVSKLLPCKRAEDRQGLPTIRNLTPHRKLCKWHCGASLRKGQMPEDLLVRLFAKNRLIDLDYWFHEIP